MGRLKQTVKSCLRPLYAPAVRRCRALYYQLRGSVATHLEAQLRPHFSQLSAEVSESVQGSDVLLALLKANGTSRPARAWAAPISASRLLTGHPLLPFMYLDPADLYATPRVILGDYRLAVRLALERLVRPGAAAVEVGARQGFLTLLLAGLVGPSGRVLAYEPDPARFAVLADNVAAHRLADTVTARPAALGDELDRLGWTPDLILLGAAGREKAILEPLWPRLADAPSTRLLLDGPLSPQDGPEVLRRLARLGLRLWQVQPEGTLTPMPDDPRTQTAVVAARSFE